MLPWMYTSHGHDGLLKNKFILNDETVEILIVNHYYKMGCDVLAHLT